MLLTHKPEKMLTPGVRGPQSQVPLRGGRVLFPGPESYSRKWETPKKPRVRTPSLQQAQGPFGDLSLPPPPVGLPSCKGLGSMSPCSSRRSCGPQRRHLSHKAGRAACSAGPPPATETTFSEASRGGCACEDSPPFTMWLV